MTENNLKLQTQFIEQLKAKLPPGESLHFHLARVLGLSRSVAYKKLNAESTLTLDQVQLLCKAFQFNFQISGMEHRHTASVDFSPFSLGSLSVAQYLGNLNKFLSGIAKGSNARLSCATDDIPIFHLFKYPELTAFKLHYWQFRAVADSPHELKFQSWSNATLQQAYQLYQQYLKIPSTEIWTHSSLLNTLAQIQHAASVGIITDQSFGRLICRQLESALLDIEAYAKATEKAAGTSFSWLFYDVIGSISYLAEYDNSNEVFLRFNTFNTIHESKGPLSSEVKFWMDSLKRDATGFSGQGSFQRHKYLAEAKAQIAAVADRF